MASRRTNFGERSEPAPDRGGKLQSAGGGGGRHKVTFRHWPEQRKPAITNLGPHHQFGHASSTNLTNFSSIPCYKKFSQI